MNALDDPKIAALICKYGFIGYGWFWAVVELLRQQSEYKYPMKKYTFDAFAKRLQCEPDAAKNFIGDCCHEFADDKSALLCMDDNYIWSESLIRRMQGIDKRRESARNSAFARWGKGECERNAIAMPSQCEPNAVKESKVKESKDIYITVQHLSMSTKEYEKLISLYGKEEVEDKIESAMNYKGLKNYTSLYLTLNKWCKKDKKDKPPDRYDGIKL